MIYTTFKQWMYRNGRPHTLAKILNRIQAILHERGLIAEHLVTLEVMGRKSGKPIRFPLVVAAVDGQKYLVSMLGNDANWVQNVRSANGKATLYHGIREDVLLTEVDVQLRASILKAYLQKADGARPHIPVHKDAPIAAFAKVAAEYPVFRLETMVTVEQQ